MTWLRRPRPSPVPTPDVAAEFVKEQKVHADAQLDQALEELERAVVQIREAVEATSTKGDPIHRERRRRDPAS